MASPPWAQVHGISTPRLQVVGLHVACCAIQCGSRGLFLGFGAAPIHRGPKNRAKIRGSNALRHSSVRGGGENCGGITSGSSSGGAEGSRKSRRSRAPPSPERARGPPRWPGAAGRAAPGCARSYPMVLGPGPHYQCTPYEGCMRHNGDHNGYVLTCDDPLTTLPISPELMLDHCAPPSYAMASHLRRHT